MAADGTITLKTSIDKTGAIRDLNSLLSELNKSISKGLVVSVGASGASEAVKAVKEITTETEKSTKKRKEASKNASKEEAESARLTKAEIKERERQYKELFDVIAEREVESAREAANAAAEYGKQMANAASESGNATSAVQQFQQIYEKALRDGDTAQAKIVSSMQKTISGIERQSVLTEQYRQKLSELYAQQHQIGGEGVDIKLDTEIASYTQKLAQAQSNTNELAAALQNLTDSARKSGANLSSVESTLNRYGASAARLTKEEIKERERQYEALFDWIESMEAERARRAREETRRRELEYEDLFRMIDLKEAESARAVEEAGKATKDASRTTSETAPIADTGTYNQLEQDITTLQDRIRQATEAGNTAQAESYRKLMSDISSYYKKLEDADALIAKREDAPESQYQEITAQIGKAQAEAEKFAASITDTIKNARTLNIRLAGIESLDAFRDNAASARAAANASSEYGNQMAAVASTSGRATSAVQQFQQIYEKALQDGDTAQAKIVSSMQKTISGIERQSVLTEQYRQKLSELYAQQHQIGGEGVDIKLDTEIASYTQKLAQAQSNTNKLTAELQRLSDTARKSGANLSSVENTLKEYGTTAKRSGVQTTGLRGRILQLYKAATSGSRAATKATNSFAGGLNKISERFKGLTSRVFVFSVWTMAMRGLRNTIANVLKGNEEFNNSLEKLKASLWTAFAPTINLVVPILTKLVQWITAAITAITKFIAKLAGVSYESLVKGGKALSEQSKGYDDVADSADKAKKAQDRYLASFDKINKAQDTSKDTSDKEVTQPSPFDSLGKSTLSKDVEEQLNKIMAIIGGALIAVGVILCLVGAVPAGISMILIGAATLFGSAAIAWNSTNKEVQKTLQTIMTIIGLSIMVIGVILICVGHIPLGIMLIVIGALALYGSSQLDNSKSTKTVKEVLTEIALVVAAALLAIGVILVCVGNLPLGIALIVAGIAIAAAALKFGEVSQKTKETIAAIALIAGASLLVLGVILVCFGIFPLGIGLIVAGAGSLGVAMLTGKDTVLKVVKSIWNAIKTFWSHYIAIIFTAQFWRAKFSAIGNGLKTAVKAALNGLIWIINKFIDGLNLMLIPQRVLIMSIAKLFGSDLALDDIKIPHIPQLAKGGIVPTQTLAMIGERGKEAVIPLENNLGWLDKMSDMIANKVGAGESTINLTIQLDGSVIYKDIVKRNREATRRTGKNALV